MFRHVVILTWRPETTDDQKQRVSAELAALPGLIPEMRGYSFGPDAGINEGNGQFSIVADFDNVADYLVYRDNPDHLKMIADFIRPITAQRSAAQFEF